MARIFRQRGLIPLDDITSGPPPDETHLIEKYLLQVIDELHKDPRAHRSFYKCPNRRLKIVSHYYDCGHYHVPKVNLLGKWLAAAGFEIGQYTRVFTLKKVLVICLDEDYLKNDIRK